MSRLRTVAAALALLMLPASAPAAASGFRSMAREIDRTPGIDRVRVPFLGVARLALRLGAAAEAGVGDVRLALYEVRREPDRALLDRVLARAGDDWRPVVRIRGRGETVAILVRPDRELLHLLVVAQDEAEMVLLQLEGGREELLALVADPVREAGELAGGR